jgi:GNAT superfamily N-acetyltransferase
MNQTSPEKASPIVRRAVQKDIPQILEMIKALAEFHDDTPKICQSALERDALGETPWIYLLVAEVGDKLVGYTALCPLVQLHNGTRGIDMHHLFVSQNMRARGVGRALVQGSLATARNLFCEYMMVGTDDKNTAAQEFYLNSGFRRNKKVSPRFICSV